MIDEIVTFIQQATAYHESDTSRDGFLSYKSETHAFVFGMYDGIRTLPFQTVPIRDHPEVQKEKPYYVGGFVVSTVLQILTILFLGIVLKPYFS